MRVYLDACSLSRLTDDQSQARIREEAEAVEQVLVGVRRGTVELLSSEALDDEVRRNPSLERRRFHEDPSSTGPRDPYQLNINSFRAC